jgi:hypothetical protein
MENDMSKSFSTYSDYSAFAHAVVRASDGRLGINGSGLLSLFAKARGFDSPQAFKASFPVSPEAGQPVMGSADARPADSPREKISAEFRSSLHEFFFSEYEVSMNVRAALTRIIFHAGALRNNHVRNELCAGLDNRFIDELFSYPLTSREFDLDYIVKVYGDQAYKDLCNSHNVVHMRFPDGLLFRVQKGAAELAFRDMLDEVVILLQQLLSSPLERQAIINSNNGSADSESLLHNKDFHRRITDIISSVSISEYMN